MDFICKDCANAVHDVCKRQHCECQHRTDRKNQENQENQE